MHPAFESEKIYLSKTIKTIEEEIIKLENEINKLNNDIEKLKQSSKGVFSNELVTKNTLFNSKTRKLNLLITAKDKPYFGRIDFEELGKDEETFYIGKTSVSKGKDEERLVIDWRAPIGGLYYSGELGEVMYNAPKGLIIGDLNLKRQYNIENKELLNVFDKGITPMDEYLQDALSQKKDNRLRDIVNTIQSEQNDIIRADKDKTVIVQGVAGSGKTTIVLHRIAYLLYTYQNIFNTENILIVVPNKLFLNYISDVLPDLGVEDIVQFTYEELGMKMLNKEYNLTSSEDMIINLIDYNLCDTKKRENLRKISRFKGSLQLKGIIDSYIYELSKTYVPKKDLIIEGYNIYDYEYINNLFHNEFIYLPLIPRVKRIKNYIKDTIKDKTSIIIKGINKKYDKLIKNTKNNISDDNLLKNELIKLYDERDTLINDIEKNTNKAVIDYFKDWKLIDIDNLYREIITNKSILNNYSKDKLSDEDLVNICSYTLEIFNKGLIEKADITPIVYIHMKLIGLNNINKFRHIIVDEAQDYSEFEMYVLRSLNTSNSFTIVGDLSQGIHSYKGINNWNDLIKDVFDESYLEYLTLKKCYRSTYEIMNLANSIIRSPENEGILAEPVLRYGDEPELIKKDNYNDMIQDIEIKINDLKEEGHKSIAIICKLPNDSKKVYNELLKKGINEVTLITDKDTIYGGGIVVIPSYIAKGLEFDAVIIYDCSYDNYIKDDIHTKLLYVSVTRALHKLFIYYVDKPSELLKNN